MEKSLLSKQLHESALPSHSLYTDHADMLSALRLVNDIIINDLSSVEMTLRIVPN